MAHDDMEEIIPGFHVSPDAARAIRAEHPELRKGVAAILPGDAKVRMNFKHRLTLVADIEAENRDEAEIIADGFWRDEETRKNYRIVSNELVLDL